MSDPTRAQQSAAMHELCSIAQALGSPRVSFSEAMSTARGARPDLAATVDAGTFSPWPTVATGARRRTPAPNAHGALLTLADKLRSLDPSLTAATAYAQALTGSVDLRAQLARESHDADQDMMLAERARAGRIAFGEQLGRPVGAIAPDAEYAAKPTAWARRGAELYTSGRAASPEIGYSMAMAESATAAPGRGPTPEPTPTETQLGSSHDRWSERASELYRAGRVPTWQQGYAVAMNESA